MVDPTVERTPKHTRVVVTLEGEQLHGWLREKLGTPPNATGFYVWASPDPKDPCYGIGTAHHPHKLFVSWDEPEAVAEGKL